MPSGDSPKGKRSEPSSANRTGRDQPPALPRAGAAFPYEFKNAYGEAAGARRPKRRWSGIWRRTAPSGCCACCRYRDAPPAEYLAEMWQDIRYGLRMLAGSPGFTAVAVISLTLGIGVATSAFSEMNGFVLRDVPGVENPGELVLVEAPTSYPKYKPLPRAPGSFPLDVRLRGANALRCRAGRPHRTHVGPPGDVFLLLDPWRATRLLGRFFGPEHEQPGRAPDVVVSYRFWQDHLGSDPAAMGKTLRINGQPCNVMGVGPEDFQGASPMVYGADMWLPAAVAGPASHPNWPRMRWSGTTGDFHVAGRLQPGVPAARAEAALDAIAQQLEVSTAARTATARAAA